MCASTRRSASSVTAGRWWITSPSDESFTKRTRGPGMGRILIRALRLEWRSSRASASRGAAHRRQASDHRRRHRLQRRGADRAVPRERRVRRRDPRGGFGQHRRDTRRRRATRRARRAEGVARLRAPEAARGVPREERLGALARCRRARERGARALDPRRDAAGALQGLSRGAAQPLSRPLARARRGLSGLVAASLPPGARGLVERRGARGGAHDRRSRKARGRLAARFRGGYRDLHGEAESLHEPARACAVCAGCARGLLAARREPARALRQVLRAAPRLPRWRPGLRAHRHRLPYELPEVREADRAAESRGKAGRMILVTGGAGFIGSNFVVDWIAAAGEPLLNLDKLTYAGNLANLATLAN